MRNLWYPQKKAEFMTATRFKELGMTRADISDRDHLLGTFAAAPEPAETRLSLGDEASAVKVKHPTVRSPMNSNRTSTERVANLNSDRPSDHTRFLIP